MKRKSFEEKVKSMSAAQIIRAMIRGLEKEHVKVDMSSFGHYDPDHNTCFGCAATNCVLEIYSSEIRRPVFSVGDDEFTGMATYVNTTRAFISDFEHAIDALRTGDVHYYNNRATKQGFAVITNSEIYLPELDTLDYLDNLAPYEALAKAQEPK